MSLSMSKLFGIGAAVEKANKKEVARIMFVREKKLGAILLGWIGSVEVCKNKCDAVMLIDLRELRPVKEHSFEEEVLIIYPQSFVKLIIGPLRHPTDEAHGAVKLWYKRIQQSFWDKLSQKGLQKFLVS